MELSRASQVFLVNGPMVVSDTIDGESIILHHRTGKYYSTRQTGAIIWEGIEAGADAASLAARLQHACGVDAPRARDAVLAFIDLLRSHDLVKMGPDEGVQLPLPEPQRVAFVTPELDVHEDLADMLLLDPIHDVTEEGWPSAKLSA